MDKIYISHYHSPIGEITMAGNGEALIGLWFDGQKYFADTIDRDVEEQELQVFAETDRWLTLYFQGQEPDFTPPIAFGAKVSEFRKEVWKILLSIPYGKTLTTGTLPDRLVPGRVSTGCLPRRWVALWGTIPSLLLFPVTGWWEPTGALPDMPVALIKK